MDHKHKKRIIEARNKRNQRIFQHAEQHADNLEKERDREQELREAEEGVDTGGKEVVWSERLQEIRDKVTKKKRMAKERWNRYSGTESGGARGL